MVEKKKDFEIKTVSEKDVTILKVNTILDMPLRKAFSDATQKLLNSNTSNLLLDMTETPSVFSLFIGSIVDLHKNSEDAGKKLIVVVNPKVAKLFQVLSFDSLLNLRIK